MAGKGRKWLIGCGAGCGAFTLIMIFIAVGGGYLMMKPFNQAVQKQATLEEQFGSREDFVPLPDGLTADRIAAFLVVRQELMNKCGAFEDIAASFRQMDELDKGDGQDPPVGDVLKGVGNVMGSAFSVAGEIGALTNSRNNELLKNHMGLGEYTWIYVLAYYSWLGHEPGTGLEGEGHGGFSGSERQVFRQLMQNHARALEETGRTDEANRWRDEAERLHRSEGEAPFPSGDLPAEITAQLAPYRAKFEATYCAAMSEFELGRVQKKGLSFRSE